MMKFPTYNGEALAWSIGLYFTQAEAELGYPRAKCVIATMMQYRPAQLLHERNQAIKDTFGIFSHNAKTYLKLIEEVMNGGKMA